MNEPNPAASRTGLVIVVSAPSGGGKSSLCQRLLNWSSNIVYSVSCTTRAPRGGEQDGHDYFFLSTEEFERKIAAGEFLEYAKYNNNYYGTPRGFVEEQLADGARRVAGHRGAGGAAGGASACAGASSPIPTRW